MKETAEQIQERMEALRCHLADDVGDVVHSTKRMADWREHVKRYPWACVGTATAIGYLIVPRRLEIISPDTDTMLELARKNQLVVSANPTPHEQGRGMLGTLLTLAGNAAVRGAHDLSEWADRQDGHPIEL